MSSSYVTHEHSGELLEPAEARDSRTYVSVEPYRLHRYLDEQSFRYNNRSKEIRDGGRFRLAVVADRRQETARAR